MTALTPRIDLCTSVEALRAEVIRLGHEINKVVVRQELAWHRGNDGKTRRGIECTTIPTFKVVVCTRPRLNGFQIVDMTQINVSPRTTWACIVETLCHELCHRMRPWHERPTHSDEFWYLLNTSLRECYGVGVPLPPFEKGTGQFWWRDDVACQDLCKKYEWASALPLKKIKGSNL